MWFFSFCLILSCGGDTNKVIKDNKDKNPITLASDKDGVVKEKSQKLSKEVEKNSYIQKAQMELKEASSKTDCMVEYLEKKEEGNTQIAYETYCEDFLKKKAE